MKWLTLTFLALAISSCDPVIYEDSKSEKPLSNQIILIFNNPVQNGFYEIPGTNGKSQSRNQEGDEIQFLDDNMIEQLLNLNIGAVSDTVIIKTQRNIVEVRLMYKGVDELKYLFQNGDSIVFDYQGIKPIARILNREEEYLVTNFSLIERDSLSADEYTALDINKLPILLSHRASGTLESYLATMKQIEEKALNNLFVELQNQYAFLKRLKKENKITQNHYEYRLQNLYFQLAELNLSPLLKKDIEGAKAMAIKRAIEDFKVQNPDILINRTDSLIYNNAYTKYLLFSTSLEIRDKVSAYNYNTGQSGGRILNYPEAYDSIQTFTNLSPTEKKRIQFGYMFQLFSDAGYFPIETRWEYLDKFRNEYQDTAMINFLIKKFNIKPTIEDDLILVDQTGKEDFFEKIISSHEGKVIFVDYWASWCGPCIKEMPSSMQLQKDLEGKNIIYLYLSSDRTDKPWLKAMERLKLNKGLHYRIDNAGYSTKMEELNIPSIPRYMIYDTKGNLVNNDAPRPSDKIALKQELMKYIETSR